VCTYIFIKYIGRFRSVKSFITSDQFKKQANNKLQRLLHHSCSQKTRGARQVTLEGLCLLV